MVQQENQSKLLERVAEVKIRLDRGNSIIYWVKNIMILMASIKIILEISSTTTLMLCVFAVIMIFLIGWLDINYIKLFQKEQELTTGKYNPFFRKRLGVQKV